MTIPKDIIQRINDLSKHLVGTSMSKDLARLYSHQTRLRSGQPGLSSWRDSETIDRLSEAEILVETGFIKREVDDKSWRLDFRRSAELFEWLSALPIKNEEMPFTLLSAAAYQLAGYPARALGVINSNVNYASSTNMVTCFLKNDFQKLFIDLANYWLNDSTALKENISPLDENLLETEIRRSIAAAMGVFASWLRWGMDDRLDRAVVKFKAVSQVMTHDVNVFSWLLAHLVSEIAGEYKKTSLRLSLKAITERKDIEGKIAFERYLRLAFLNNSSLAWPSQRDGIAHILTERSFALCTPTGSGKTRVAELAILDSLFSSKDSLPITEHIPIVLYLVPKRALAAEVEVKLSRVLRYVGLGKITVTSLYGGSDWGPSDTFLSLDQRSVVISTHEKAEALIRFLGKDFVDRIKLIVIDEAHNVAYEGSGDDLKDLSSRALRLEILVGRLLSYLRGNGSRAIALSAVAAGIEENLAKWVSSGEESKPVITQYRSTRQLIGRLQCLPNRTVRIGYDLLDGQRLNVQTGNVDESPYIPNPFPPYPRAEAFEMAGPEKKLRPYAFWSALHLAAKDKEGQYHSVLISVLQQPGGYADDLLQLLNDTWKDKKIPDYFNKPTDGSTLEKFSRCLKSCEDYFGEDSREYRLLSHGIVLHHGKMPGLMSRLLVELVQNRIVNVVIATSTLTEGVNLPFEVILLPTLRRTNIYIEKREFTNLIGRAGRPGTSTEGRTLVLVDQTSNDYSAKKVREVYFDLVAELSAETSSIPSTVKQDAGPLEHLLMFIYQKWTELAKSTSTKEFVAWLETTACDQTGTTKNDALDSLDTLDGILLGAIAEVESQLSDDQDKIHYEKILQNLWKNTFSYYGSTVKDELEKIIIIRGGTVFHKLYPDKKIRKRIYKTSLVPREGKKLIDIIANIKELFKTGEKYYLWNSEERIKYIIDLISVVQPIQSFTLDKTAKSEDWRKILHWWLDPSSSPKKPTPEQVSKWYNYGAQNFAYKFNWALGCAIGLILQDSATDKSTLDRWSDLGLPWSVFWLKDVITWGLLDPVAVYLMMHDTADTRAEAIEQASQYWKQDKGKPKNDSIFDPRKIAEWAPVSIEQHQLFDADSVRLEGFPCKAELVEDFGEQAGREFRIIPVTHELNINWVDPSGFVLARSETPKNWDNKVIETYDFMLNPKKKTVSASRYL